MERKLKYVFLFVFGTGIVLLVNHFNNSIPFTSVEYKYSYALRDGYNILTAIIFLIAGLFSGYCFQLNPWLTGLFLVLAFPVVAIYEASVYTGSHNLIPFEFIIHFIYSLPAVLGVYIGKYISKIQIKKNVIY